MKRIANLFYFAPLLCCLIAGCAQLGLVNAQSFDERAAYVAASITATNQTATNALTSHQITVLEAEQVRSITYNAAELLRAADIVHKGGNDAAAGARLTAVQSLLEQVQKYIATARKNPPVPPEH